ILDTHLLLFKVILFEIPFVTMVAIGSRGTVMQHPKFNADEDAKKLWVAMKGAGTDEAAIFNIIAFKASFGKDLADEIKSELTGHFEKVVLGLLMPAPVYDGHELHHKSMKGLGTTDSILIRVKVSLCEVNMLDIKVQVLKMYGKTLFLFIKGDCSGDYRNILLSLCGGDN
uniref:Annexin A4 n=1 Tax=Erpetoichthys calabaricus TaxID=27687 RepID=A0A8C4T8Y4_ERPCA